MAEEPTNGELARRLDDLKTLVVGLVGRHEYDADKRAIEARFDEMGARLEDVRHQHHEDIRVVHERISAGNTSGVQNRQHWQSLLWQGLLPALVAAVGIWVAYLAGHGGSH